jgi:hypothetical protein
MKGMTWSLVLLLGLAQFTRAQEPPGPAVEGGGVTGGAEYLPGLTEGLTRSLAVRYGRARHWALRGFVLLALGERWHPLGAELVLEGLRSKERRLRVYALECLDRTNADALRRVASAELIDELVAHQIKESDPTYRTRVQRVLTRLFPGAEARKPDEWRSVWRARKDSYVRPPWIPPPPPKGDGRTSAMAGVERAFDLHEAGLDLVICLDTTGSMQPTIDATRASIDDLVLLLSAIAPKFRIGLVEYKDYVDLPAGAQVLEPLTARPARVEKRLRRLVAAGGGDYPEAVAAGLSVALGEDVGWERSTNKLLLVIGDAPPKETRRALDLARNAHERPFGVDPSDLSVGRGRTRSIVRPFVIATVGVGSGAVPRPTEKAFMRLAQAGGGAYAKLLTRPSAVNGEPLPASEAIARHVLTLAFGAQWQGQVEAFVEVYMQYHHSGFLK